MATNGQPMSGDITNYTTTPTYYTYTYTYIYHLNFTELSDLRADRADDRHVAPAAPRLLQLLIYVLCMYTSIYIYISSNLDQHLPSGPSMDYCK